MMQSLKLAALKAAQALEESIEYTQVPSWSPSIERRREALQALRAALHEGAEVPGWKLVPLTPTPQMIRAHDEVLQMIDRTWIPSASVTSSAYRAMLLTAPRWDTLRSAELGTAAVSPSRRNPTPAVSAMPVRRVMVRP